MINWKASREDLIQISFQQVASANPFRHDLVTSGEDFNIDWPLWRKLLANQDRDNSETDPSGPFY